MTDQAHARFGGYAVRSRPGTRVNITGEDPHSGGFSASPQRWAGGDGSADLPAGLLEKRGKADRGGATGWRARFCFPDRDPARSTKTPAGKGGRERVVTVGLGWHSPVRVPDTS